MINSNWHSNKEIEFASRIRQWFHNPESHWICRLVGSSIVFIHLGCATVFEWARCFTYGQLNIGGNPSCGRPIAATNNETVKDVKSLITKDRRITIQQIVYVLDVSTYTVRSIIHNQLHMTKVSSRWVLHLLASDQRHERV